MRYSVLHLGVPLGWVDLPEDRAWAGGLLDPAPGYEALSETLKAVAREAGRDAAAGLLWLPAGETPMARRLSDGAAETLRRAAELRFELRDERGRPVAADVVRLMDLDDGAGGRVAAHFRAATADTPAFLPSTERQAGDYRDPRE